MNPAAPEKPIRAFIAIHLPNDLLEVIVGLQERLKSHFPAGAIRWAQPDQIHLTLRFLGSVSASALPELQEALRQAACGIPSFQLTAGGLGCFPGPNQPRVIWVGVTGQVEVLERLETQVGRATAAWGEREERSFHPHLTLARPKHLAPAEKRTLKDLLYGAVHEPLGSWSVTQISLMQSRLLPEGAHYEQLAAASLDVAL